MKRIGHAIEMVISQSRWLILPFLIGLVVGLGALAITFVFWSSRKAAGSFYRS